METILKVIRGVIDDKLQKDGRNIYTYKGIDTNFFVTEPFLIASTIKVKKNGTSLDSVHWAYDSDTGYLNIDVQSGETLVTDDEIEMNFHYYKKHSDEGLIGFVCAGLAYFVMYRYPKVFEVDEDNEISTIEGLEPTVEDKYLIGLVSGIVAEPNLVISTPDFSFKENDTRTPTEKISEIFRKANRAKGIVDFIDKECL